MYFMTKFKTLCSYIVFTVNKYVRRKILCDINLLTFLSCCCRVFIRYFPSTEKIKEDIRFEHLFENKSNDKLTITLYEICCLGKKKTCTRISFPTFFLIRIEGVVVRVKLYTKIVKKIISRLCKEEKTEHLNGIYKLLSIRFHFVTHFLYGYCYCLINKFSLTHFTSFAFLKLRRTHHFIFCCTMGKKCLNIYKQNVNIFLNNGLYNVNPKLQGYVHIWQ